MKEVPLRQTGRINVTPTLTVMKKNIHAYPGAVLTESPGINSFVSVLVSQWFDYSSSKLKVTVPRLPHSCMYILIHTLTRENFQRRIIAFLIITGI
jgi:hypothetical protein